MDEDRQERAKGNRASMPRFVVWLDGVVSVFGSCRVLYARDGEVEAGVRFEDRLVDGRWPK